MSDIGEKGTGNREEGTGEKRESASRRSGLWLVLQLVARLGVRVFFDLRTFGRENVPATGGVLLVANHQSNLDPVLVAVRLRRPVSFMAKSELFENRWLNWLIRALHAFPVRQNHGDLGAVRQCIQRLGEGYALNIYPEGTRSEDGQIAPLQKGVALILRKSDVPVVPVAIDGSFDAWPYNKKMFRPRPIQVMYGKPMSFKGMDADSIVKSLHEALSSLLETLKKEHPLDRCISK
jgi:1-acyl-sn-glycerol-3-phosphate acyltransferase